MLLTINCIGDPRDKTLLTLKSFPLTGLVGSLMCMPCKSEVLAEGPELGRAHRKKMGMYLAKWQAVC